MLWQNKFGQQPFERSTAAPVRGLVVLAEVELAFSASAASSVLAGLRATFDRPHRVDRGRALVPFRGQAGLDSVAACFGAADGGHERLC